MTVERLHVLLLQVLRKERQAARPGDIGAGLVVAGALIAVEAVLRAGVDVVRLNFSPFLPLTQSFFIVPTSVKGAVQTLFSTHPSMEQRIERLRDRTLQTMSGRQCVGVEVLGGGKVGDREIASRAYVAAFNFKGADQQKRVGVLSGGERNRVHLAKMLKREHNVILLDEPTNDLDVDTLRSLEVALEDFAGCAVIISHDRWFLDRIATHILAFEGDSHVEWFEGNFQDYEEDKKRRLGADSELNYRRFFAVNTLAGLRVEDPAVFDATHVEVKRWFDEGLVDEEAGLYRARLAEVPLLRYYARMQALSVAHASGVSIEALRRGELTPFYQPIVRLDTAAIVGFEALMLGPSPARRAAISISVIAHSAVAKDSTSS